MFFYSYLQTRYHQDISDSVSISISIPTSNLTNVMAGILAKEMRLPFHKLIVACSENDSFIDFVKTGVYKTDLLYDKVYNDKNLVNDCRIVRILQSMESFSSIFVEFCISC